MTLSGEGLGTNPHGPHSNSPKLNDELPGSSSTSRFLKHKHHKRQPMLGLGDVKFRSQRSERKAPKSLAGVGAKAPIPPVFGPWSPSLMRLWSWSLCSCNDLDEHCRDWWGPANMAL